MGDRGNVYVKMHGGPDDKTGVYLYTHWGGSTLPSIVQQTLRRSDERWNDEPYLTRVLFCDLVQGSERELTGFGITTYLTDNEHSIVVVDCEKATVGFAHPGEEPQTYRSWSFQEYIAASAQDLEAAFNEGGEAEEG